FDCVQCSLLSTGRVLMVSMMLRLGVAPALAAASSYAICLLYIGGAAPTTMQSQACDTCSHPPGGVRVLFGNDCGLDLDRNVVGYPAVGAGPLVSGLQDVEVERPLGHHALPAPRRIGRRAIGAEPHLHVVDRSPGVLLDDLDGQPMLRRGDDRDAELGSR